MGMWQQIGLIALAVAVVVLFGPGAKRVAENSPEGSRQDWMTAVKLLGAVVLGVVVMILILRG